MVFVRSKHLFYFQRSYNINKTVAIPAPAIKFISVSSHISSTTPHSSSPPYSKHYDQDKEAPETTELVH